MKTAGLTPGGSKTRPALSLLALLAAVAALPPFAHAIGEAGDTDWPAGATVQLQLRLSATLDSDGRPQVSGDLIVTNPSDSPLTVQDADNRLVIAFLVFDSLGNPVAPKGVAKTDPAFATLRLAPRETYTHHFNTLDFVTGSIQQSYSLERGRSYRVVAIYRPAGPNGPGFASQETKVEIPK